MKSSIKLACNVGCVKCRRAVTGTLCLDDKLTVCDSIGFIIVGRHNIRIVCDRCADKAGLPGREIVTRADVEDPKTRDRLADQFADAFDDEDGSPEPAKA